jgi:aminoglycoside phosphotransferase (APT) family kinase protein
MPTATGFSNETVFFSATWQKGGAEHTRKFVARIEPEDGGIFPVQSPACEVSAELQHRIMSAVGALHTVPVPPLLSYESDPSVLGRPFFVMEFVTGEIPADVPRYSQAGFLVDDATPADRESMVFGTIEAMSALHKLDWREVGLDWLDPSDDGKPVMAHQMRLYRDYVARELAGRDHSVIMQSLDWLDANVPNAESGLSWGDSRLGNVIFRDYRCAAVVDWEAAALCPPEADIGWFVMFDRMSFDDMEVPRLEGFPTREQMVAHWETCTGRVVGADIHYWEVFAVMRFCAIFIRLGDRITGAGLAPVEANMPIQNGVTDALARLLEKSG